MNPNSKGEAPANFEMPQPPAPEGEESHREQGQEAPAARPESAGNQPARPALPAVPDDIPAADQSAAAAPPQDKPVSAPTDDSSPPAKESDHIEKQWIDKAKNVVARTQDDPYMQKHEMSKVKAEYIQKRFNKQIKTDEATT